MRVIGQESVAEMFGVAPKTIVEWQEQGLPVASRGRPGVPSEYESRDCIDWFVQRALARVNAEQPRDRLVRLQGDDLEIELAIKRGTLVAPSEIEPKLRAAIISAREQLLGLRTSVVPALVGKTVREMQDELERAHEDFLRRLSNWQAAKHHEEEDE